MQSPVMVFDDFFAEPDKLREKALSFDYPAHTVETYFPGQNSVQKLLIPGLTETMSKVVGERLAPVAGTSHENCRLALDDAKGAGGVHIDQAHWTGVYYLTKPEDCQGGTDFFRHLPSNTDHAPVSAEELALFGCSTYSELWDDVIHPHSNDRSKWEHILNVPMKYNRLILFRPWYWHDAGPGFGNSVENGRLIFTLFYQEAP